MPTPNVPETVSHFQIGRPVQGRDLLYEARDTRDGSSALVQFVSQADAAFEARALAAAELRSPYTARLLGYGADGQIGWLAYESVEGVAAAELARRGSLTPGAAFRATAKAARALQEAQAREVAHGGVSPEAIAIDGLSVKLLGFGVQPAPRGIAGDITDLGETAVALLSGRQSTGTTTVTQVPGLESLPEPLARVLDHTLSGGDGDPAVVARQFEAAARAVEPVLTGVNVELTRRGTRKENAWAVRVTNSDDIPATVTLAPAPGCDPALALTLPGMVTVAAGETLVIPVEVKPGKRRWRGARKARAFAIIAALPALDVLLAHATAGGGAAGVVTGVTAAGTVASVTGSSASVVAGAGSMAAAPATTGTSAIGGAGSMASAPAGTAGMGGTHSTVLAGKSGAGAWSGPSPVTTAQASFVDKPVGMVAMGALGGATVAVTAAVVVPVAVLAGGGGSEPAIPETPTPVVTVTQTPATPTAQPSRTVVTPSATATASPSASATASASPSPSASVSTTPGTGTATPTATTPSNNSSTTVTTTPVPSSQTPVPTATASPTAPATVTATATASPPPPTPTVSPIFLADQQYLAAICPVQKAYVPAVMQLVNDINGGADPQTAMNTIKPAIQAYAAGIAAATPPADIAGFHAQWVALAQAAATAVSSGSPDAFDALGDIQVPELPADVLARWEQVIPTVPACIGSGIG